MKKRTREEIEADFRRREYGICAHCEKELNYDEKFIDVAEGVCGCSQGMPCAWVDKPTRYHIECYKKLISKS